MKKVWDAIAKDLWVIVLDIVAVNASYFLALLIRFYVNFQLRPVAVDRYLPNFQAFAPWYTVLCLVVFAAWRLYGGLWRYAGINDMNRIIGANLCTTAIHVVGSLLFFTRMPITYYFIGALLQFLLVTTIRFAYRVLLVEKKKINAMRGKRIATVIIGAGENGRRVAKSLEESDIYRPIAVVGSKSGVMDGIPIVPLTEMPEAQAIFIADPLLPSEERQRIKALADEKQIEFHEYTGFFSNLGGKLSVTELLATIRTPLTLVLNGEEKAFSCGEDALQALTDKYSVSEISGEQLVLTLTPTKKMTAKEKLEQAYAAVMDEEQL